jgi:hypothetical protein
MHKGWPQPTMLRGVHVKLATRLLDNQDQRLLVRL